MNIYETEAKVLNNRINDLQCKLELALDTIEHSGYDPDDCIDCGGPPHNEHCRFYRLRDLLSFWDEDDDYEYYRELEEDEIDTARSIRGMLVP
jgi:hypothetical protein